MSGSPDESAIEELVREALQSMYSENIRPEIVENVEVEYIEKDVAHHIVDCRARNLKLDNGRVYQGTVSSHDIEFTLGEVQGFGGEYRLRVNFP